jgi:hypothetical protein
MRLVKVEPRPPQALRVLVQGADDAGSIEFTFAAAAAWSDRPLLVINATGKDLHAFGERYSMVEIQDDAGRPSRSLTEIIGVLEDLNPAEWGAVVVLDANRLYRATRCAVRDAKEVENLSAGQWDNTNEALGELGERLTRLGLPSIFFAPPTDVYGVDAQGEPVVTGTKPQAWKDLPRSAHLHVHLLRRGTTLTLEVAGDDWARLGAPGTVRLGITGASVGEAVADLARGARPGEAGGTTLAESSAAEIAARAQRLAKRQAKSAEIRARLQNIAELRAYQGRWDEFTAEIAAAMPALETSDLNSITKVSDAVLSKWSPLLTWMRGAEADLERTAFSLHEQRPDAVAGPSINMCPADGGTSNREAARLLSCAPGVAQHALRESARGPLIDRLRWLARYAGVWSEPCFAAVCLTCSLPPRGPGWDRYNDDELRLVALHVLSLALVRDAYDPPTVAANLPVSLVPKPADPPAPHAQRSVVLALPTVTEFDQMIRDRASDYLSMLMTTGGWRDRVSSLMSDAGVEPRRPQLPHTWTRSERLAVYRVLLGSVEQLMAS